MILNSRKALLSIFPINSSQKILSDHEKYIASLLSKKRSIQYKISRGNIRFLISKLFRIDPLEVPLFSLPGAAPILGKNFGYVSMSHCSDALLIGWSKNKIGVDIENLNRKSLDIRIAERFFNEKDLSRIKQMPEDLLRQEILKIWVIKESLIKWQNGNLIDGLMNWHIDNAFQNATYKNKISNVNIKNVRYKSWEIGLASSDKLNLDEIRIKFYQENIEVSEK
tara:strand:- start:7 stop:678 length:672 start_codon:yes stop_codon:yes gene_type:complete